MFLKTVSSLVTGIVACITLISTACSHLCIPEELLSKLPAIRAGSPVAGVSRERYVWRLTWLRELIRFNLYNIRERQTFSRVSNALEMLRLDDSNGSIRKQPYCVFLTGYPGCGKSTFALELAIACLKSRYGRADASDIVTLNETDEFQSEFRTRHKVVIFDDLGAEVVDRATLNPWRKIIDFVNNIRKTSLNPNVEMKGNVYIEPDLVIITSNLAHDLNIHPFMLCKQAIHRRLNRILFLHTGFSDVSELQTEEAPPRVGQIAFSRSELNVLDMESSNMSPILRENCIDSIVGDFNLHIASQEEFVERTNSGFTHVVEKGPFAAFYSDIIEPNLPTAPYLPREMECLLPWYLRVWRKICLKQETALAFGNDTVLTPQSGLVSDQRRPLLLNFLATFIDWQWFFSLPIDFESLPGDHQFQLWEDVFILPGHQMYAKEYRKAFSYGDSNGIVATWDDLKSAHSIHLSSTSLSQEEVSNLLESPIGELGALDVPNSIVVKPEVIFPDRLLDPSGPLLSFVQEQDIDFPLAQELLATVPGPFSLVLREWSYVKGRGDFVFRTRIKKKYHFLVVEVKRSGVDNNQLHRSAFYFDRELRQHYDHKDCMIMHMSINSTRFFIPRYFSGSDDEMVRLHFHIWCCDWYQHFQALRCAEPTEGKDGSTINSIVPEKE